MVISWPAVGGGLAVVVAWLCASVDGGSRIVGELDVAPYRPPRWVAHFPLLSLGWEGLRVFLDFLCRAEGWTVREFCLPFDDVPWIRCLALSGAEPPAGAPVAVLHHPSAPAAVFSERLARALRSAGYRVFAVPPAGIPGSMADHTAWYLRVVGAIHEAYPGAPILLHGASGGAELLCVGLLRTPGELRRVGVRGVALQGCPYQRLAEKHGAADDDPGVATLALNAGDDPVYGQIAGPEAWRADLGADAATLGARPGTTLAYCDRGSHCAFLDGWCGRSSWAERCVVAFAARVAKSGPT